MCTTPAEQPLHRLAEAFPEPTAQESGRHCFASMIAKQSCTLLVLGHPAHTLNPVLTAVGTLAQVFVAVDSIANDIQGNYHIFLLALQDGAQQRVSLGGIE